MIAAFLAHAERLIAQLEPDYLAYAVEANMLLDLAPETWPAFVTFAGEVYAALKAAHPDLPVFLTLQADWFHRDPARHAAALAAVLPFTDLIALSSYAYTEASDPRANDAYFAAVAALAPEKAVVIAETGWPAEDVADPYPVRIPADESAQRAYLEWLLLRAEELDAEFVIWFLPRDLDLFWDSTLAGLPNAATLRLFRDIGLLAGDGSARPALQVWQDWFERPLALALALATE